MNEIRFLNFDRIRRGIQRTRSVQTLSMRPLHNHLSWIPHHIPKAEVKKNQPGTTLMSISLKSGGWGWERFTLVRVKL